MGKIRAKTIGSEEEQKQKEEAKKRREAKRALKETSQKTQVSENSEHSDTQKIRNSDNQMVRKSDLSGSPSLPSVQKSEKKSSKKKRVKRIRSPRWKENIKLRDKNKQYKITDALDVLISMKRTKFDESIELHVNTTEKGVSGTFNPPHGTGKQTKVAIITPAQDPKAADELLKQIEAGKINFDILVATPDAMPLLAKVAKILGPRGLMPNPKSGTISPNPEAVAKKYEGGQLNYKTEPKFPIIHLSIGKISFGKDKLEENINVFLKSIEKIKMKNAYIKSTMGPSLRLNI